METWKKIKNIANYEVSSEGRVRNTKTGNILSGCINNRGYVRYDLSIDGKRIVRSGHRLVANAFLKKEKGKTIINHINGDKTNNSVDNIEWSTPKQNAIHSFRVLGNQASNRRKVKCVETGEIFHSILEAERKTGIKNSLI